MIDIIDIKLNDTGLNRHNEEITKQLCAMKMMQGSVSRKTGNPAPKQSVSCMVSRQGRNGKLMVKYQCLQAPYKVSDQQTTQKPEKLRQQLLVFKKS